MFLNHSIKLNFLLKSYLWPEIQHKYIKAKEGEKVQKCRSGIQVALTTLPMPTELRGQSVLLPTEQLMKGGWLYRKRLKVKTASSNGWGIKINQVHGGDNWGKVCCFKHRCKYIRFRNCLSDTAQDSAWEINTRNQQIHVIIHYLVLLRFIG